MRVEILRAKLYREQALAVGQIVEMDSETGGWFVNMGWAKPAGSPPAPLTAEAAEAVVPTQVKRRRARL